MLRSRPYTRSTTSTVWANRGNGSAPGPRPPARHRSGAGAARARARSVSGGPQRCLDPGRDGDTTTLRHHQHTHENLGVLVCAAQTPRTRPARVPSPKLQPECLDHTVSGPVTNTGNEGELPRRWAFFCS